MWHQILKIIFLPVVTGATDGIGLQYAKSVSEKSNMFKCERLINNSINL